MTDFETIDDSGNRWRESVYLGTGIDWDQDTHWSPCFEPERKPTELTDG